MNFPSSFRTLTLKAFKGTIQEAEGLERAEIDFSDRNIVDFNDMPQLWSLKNITRLTLSHNKIKELPPDMSNLKTLEILNLFNNSLERLPRTFRFPKLRWVAIFDDFTLNLYWFI